MAFNFQLEEPGTTELAKETGRVDPWALTFVQVAFSSGLHLWFPVNENGLARVTPASKEDYAAVVQVFTHRPHRAPFRWRILNVGHAIAKEGETVIVEVGVRLRLSLVSFNYPFTVNQRLSSSLVKRAGRSGIDDVTCVYGLRKVQGTLDAEFIPNSVHVRYWKDLIAKMHNEGIEVIIGYSFGSLGTGVTPYQTNYGKWLNGAGKKDLEQHVLKIQSFLKDKGLNFDGLCFDIESNAIGNDRSIGHQWKLRYFFQCAAKVFGDQGMTVSYFTGPFESRTGEVTGTVNIQRYDITEINDDLKPNKKADKEDPKGPKPPPARVADLLARPMCYDGKNAEGYDVVETSIKYALRQKTDNDGAGMHPSQLQMTLWPFRVNSATKIFPDPNAKKGSNKTITRTNTGRASMEKYCKELLRPNRIGLCVYKLPLDAYYMRQILDDCAKYDNWLNGPRPHHGLANEPYHSPRKIPTDLSLPLLSGPPL